MAQPRVYEWPATDSSAICGQQTMNAAGNLLINGTMASNGTVVFPNYSRNVSIHSTANLTGVQFTVTGTFNGSIVVSDPVTGPNNTTVYTTEIFDSITQVHVDGGFDPDLVEIGTGQSGNTAWFNSNYNSTVLGLAIQVSTLGEITYSFETTLDDVTTIRDDNDLAIFEPIQSMTDATVGDLVNYTTPSRYSRIDISSGSGSLTATFLQQGIT